MENGPFLTGAALWAGLGFPESGLSIVIDGVIASLCCWRPGHDRLMLRCFRPLAPDVNRHGGQEAFLPNGHHGKLKQCDRGGMVPVSGPKDRRPFQGATFTMILLRSGVMVNDDQPGN